MIRLPRQVIESLRPWVARDALLALGRVALGAYAVASFAFFYAAGPAATARGILRNALTDAEQRWLSVAVLGSFAFTLAYVAVIASRAKKQAADPVAAVAERSYEPFVLAPLALWPLYEAAADTHIRVFTVALMAGTFGLALHLLATRSPRGAWLDAIDPPALARIGGFAALAGALAHAVILARASVANYDSLFSGWDLAIYSQVHWNITTTGIPWSTTYSDETWNHYAIHFSPIYHVTSLLYATHRSPATLLVIENIALGLGAAPLYALAKRLTGKSSVALMVTASYVLNPCTLSLGLYDFHEIVFFVPLMFATAWAVEADEKRLLWLFVVLTLLIREDTPAYLVVYAGYLWLTDRKALAVRIGAVAAIYLVIVHGVAMPMLRAGHGYVFDDRYAGLFRVGTTGKGSVVTTLLTNPMYVVRYVIAISEKWEFVALVLLPVLALPLASKRALVLLVPGFAFSLLSAFGAQYSIDFHYTSPILPFLYLATIAALVRFEPRTRVALAAAALVSTLLFSAKRGRSPLLNPEVSRNEAAHRAAVYGERAARIHEAAKKIPKSACVRATGNLLPPVVERLRAYIVPYGRDCDYAIIDYRPEGRNGPSTYAAERAYLLERLTSTTFGVLYGDESVLIIGRGLPTDRNAEFVGRLEAQPEK